MEQLSEKDRMILHQLSLNGRLSLTALAKATGISKQVISYRIRRMEETGVILGYHAITNSYALGKAHYRIFAKYQNVSAEIEEAFLAYLEAHEKIVWIAELDGDFDIAFIVWAENVCAFEAVYDQVIERFSDIFLVKDFSIGTKIEYLKHKYFIGATETESLHFGEHLSSATLDRLDRDILADLNDEGRATLVKLANKYGTSAKVVAERIKRLERLRIIIGYDVKLNHALLGHSHQKAFLQLNDTSKEARAKLESYLRALPAVIFIVKALGSYDLEFEMIEEQHGQFHALMRTLRGRFPKVIRSFDAVQIHAEPKRGQLAQF
jgi:Lrp/AsnC family leucine-responsive transcriptional regulator